MNASQLHTPSCYGDIETVFPKGKDGLRHSPESCFDCGFKVDCLKQAMTSADGIRTKEELTDRAYRSGLIGFFERWSKKKNYARKIQEKET